MLPLLPPLLLAALLFLEELDKESAELGFSVPSLVLAANQTK